MMNLGSEFGKSLAQSVAVSCLCQYNTAQLPAKHHIIASLFATLKVSTTDWKSPSHAIPK